MRYNFKWNMPFRERRCEADCERCAPVSMVPLSRISSYALLPLCSFDSASKTADRRATGLNSAIVVFIDMVRILLILI